MNKIYTSYSPTAKNRLQNCKKNVIHVCSHDSLRHELAKCVGSLMVHRWGDCKFTNEVVDAIHHLENAIKEEFAGWAKEKIPFITEAWKNDKRRVDLVNLATGDEIEFETQKSVKKDGAVTIYI